MPVSRRMHRAAAGDLRARLSGSLIEVRAIGKNEKTLQLHRFDISQISQFRGLGDRSRFFVSSGRQGGYCLRHEWTSKSGLLCRCFESIFWSELPSAPLSRLDTAALTSVPTPQRHRATDQRRTRGLHLCSHSAAGCRAAKDPTPIKFLNTVPYLAAQVPSSFVPLHSGFPHFHTQHSLSLRNTSGARCSLPNRVRTAQYTL